MNFLSPRFACERSGIFFDLYLPITQPENLWNMSEGIFTQIRDKVTESVQNQDVPPVIDNQVVFPMVHKNDVAGVDGQKFLTEQFHLGVCLKALIGKKIGGIRFHCDDNPDQPSIGWVLALEEDEPLIISSRASLN